MSKTRRGFDDSITLISLFLFLVILLNSFTKINLTPWLTTVVMLLAGAGLMLEGKILTIKDWSKDGIQKLEIPYILSIVFGMFTLVVGILSMPMINIASPQMAFITGLVAASSMVFISLERWVFD